MNLTRAKLGATSQAARKPGARGAKEQKTAQGAKSQRQETRLRQLRAQDRDAGEEAATLASQHGVIAKNIAYLLTQLRPRAAGSRSEQAPDSRPWEIRARA